MSHLTPISFPSSSSLLLLHAYGRTLDSPTAPDPPRTVPRELMLLVITDTVVVACRVEQHVVGV